MEKHHVPCLIKFTINGWVGFSWHLSAPETLFFYWPGGIMIVTITFPF